MKIKNRWLEIAVLFGLFASVFAGYTLGSFLNITSSPGSKYDVFGFPTLPPLTKLDVPPQTVNGITATIEGAYADPSRVLFVIHLSRELGTYWTPETFLALASGEQIGVYSYMLSPIPKESQKYLMIFTPVEWLDGSQLDGQLSVGFTSPRDSTQIIKFLFDFELPIHPFLTFHPQKTVSVNGVDIFLDRVLVAPADTYMYLCFPNRSDENWILTGENITLNINRQVSNPNMPDAWLFDSTIIEGEQFGEPGWTPPNQESRCIKLGFPIGDAHPLFLTLSLPGLENAMTTPVPANDLSAADKKLLAQGIEIEWSTNQSGTVIEYKKLPEDMTEKEAYRSLLEALGYVRKGPWVFRILLFP